MSYSSKKRIRYKRGDIPIRNDTNPRTNPNPYSSPVLSQSKPYSTPTQSQSRPYSIPVQSRSKPYSTPVLSQSKPIAGEKHFLKKKHRHISKKMYFCRA